MPTDTQKRAIAIRRAEKATQRAIQNLDRDVLNELDQLYQQFVIELKAEIMNHAGVDGELAVESLRAVLLGVDGYIDSQSYMINQILDRALIASAGVGAATVSHDAVVKADAVFAAVDVVESQNDAVKFVYAFTARDGVKLSDRLWNLNQGTKQTVNSAIRRAIVQGMGSSEAVNDFLAANANAVAHEAGKAIMTGEMSPRAQALRLFRTEINRAQGEAYRNSIEDHPDVVGVKFNLSSNHPRKDICDMHATVNRYGLGKGVYPKGQSPWPAHPNTMSFETAVFIEEVTDEDKAGKQDRIDWLLEQPKNTQISVLGKGKAEYLRKGDLSERMINSTLKSVKKRVEQA